MINDLQKHTKCYELQDKLEVLAVFSSKLKHLQLSYARFNEVIENIKIIMNQKKLKSFGDEFFAMQIERSIMEILTHIFSIRDILIESGILKDDNKMVIGLKEKYQSINNKHSSLLNETLGASDNITLIQIANKIRNKITHQNLPDTKFMTLQLKPKFDHNTNIFIVCCDFHHLMELLKFHPLKQEQNGIDYTDLFSYLIDDHICLLIYGEINTTGAHFGHLKYLLKQITNGQIYWRNYINALSEYIPPQIILSPFAALEHKREYEQKLLLKLQDSLLIDREYRLFSYNHYLQKRYVKPSLRRHDFRFNLQTFIQDIYNIHFDYYSALHQMLINFHSEEIDEFFILQNEIGIEESIIEASKKRFSCKTPINQY